MNIQYCQIVILVGFSCFAQGSPVIYYGVIGGEVEFICNSSIKSGIISLSFQNKSHYLNGFHATKPTYPTRNDTTSVNKTKRAVKMWNLNAVDEGNYTCVINYGDPAGNTQDTMYFLNMTANPIATTIEPHDSGEVGRNVNRILIFGQCLCMLLFCW